MPIEDQVTDFVQQLAQEHDPETVVLALVSAVAAFDCLRRGDQHSIEELTDALMNQIEYYRSVHQAEQT